MRPTVSAETTAPCFVVVVVVVAAAVVAVVVADAATAAAAAAASVDDDNAGDNDNDQIPSYVLPTWLLKSLQSSALVSVLPL